VILQACEINTEENVKENESTKEVKRFGRTSTQFLSYDSINKK
jgi:hypothetical protein